MSRGPIEWRPIPGFSQYEASRDGGVRTVATGLHRRSYDAGDRVQLPLTDDRGVRTTRNVGALVLLAFVGRPSAGEECSHLNGDYTDNRVENLAWETHAENIARKQGHGTQNHGDNHGKTKVSDAQALEIQRRRRAGERGIDLAAEFGVSPTVVCDITKGRRVVTRAA